MLQLRPQSDTERPEDKSTDDPKKSPDLFRIHNKYSIIW